jgi:hypothetical protein
LRGGVVSVEARLLPSPTSPLWSDMDVVCELVGADPAVVAYWSSRVSPAAHALAHPQPLFGCPGCPPGGVDEDRSAEIHVWRLAVGS